MKKISYLFKVIGISVFCLSFTSCSLAYNEVFKSTPTEDSSSGLQIASFNKWQYQGKGNITLYGSNTKYSSSGLLSLLNRGILFNKNSYGYLKEININIEDSNFEAAKIFYGNNVLPITNKETLSKGENIISFDDNSVSYFVIQNYGQKFDIKNVSLKYQEVKDDINEEDNLDSIYINTEKKKSITSKTDYINCSVSTLGGNNDIANQSAKIRLRGNSTSGCPKKPYRIKFDSKCSMFGYKRSKNYALLADYMDGSRMHNYMALSFANLVHGNSEFSPKPKHVKVYLNDKYQGLYLLCEHIDEKAEHLNLAQDNIWNLNFNDINFYVDRDKSAEYDTDAKEDETFIKINISDYKMSSFIFGLKYPNKEDYIEEKDDGTSLFHEQEWLSFVRSLKAYLTEICGVFKDYEQSSSNFTSVDSLVDIPSLARYAVVDQLMTEADHVHKSFKMFRRGGGKLQFGPNWDYDACVMCLPYEHQTYATNPYSAAEPTLVKCNAFFESWGETLFKDETYGRSYFQNVWDNLTNEQLENYLADINNEISDISSSLVWDAEKWMKKQYYVAFDCLTYASSYLNSQVNYLKNELYSSNN